MGREARRAQARAERRQRRQRQQSPRNRAQQAGLSGAQTPEAARGGGGSIFKPRWATDIINELRRVTWPSRGEVGYLTVVVIIVSLVIGAFLGTADVGFGWFIENTILNN